MNLDRQDPGPWDPSRMPEGEAWRRIILARARERMRDLEERDGQAGLGPAPLFRDREPGEDHRAYLEACARARRSWLRAEARRRDLAAHGGPEPVLAPTGDGCWRLDWVALLRARRP